LSSSRSINLPVLIIGTLMIVPLIALLAVSFGNNPHAVPSVLESTPATPFTLVDLDGNTVSFDDYQGKPMVLNFWSTWCGPCKQEHPILLEAARRYPDVAFVGVIYADDPEACRRYLARAGSAYPHLIDKNGGTALDYGVAGVPESFFIDRDGVIVHKQAGPVSYPILMELMQRLRGGS
jgi:cytochrome c biogenesis protein CcmG/thiol:disulfide interchange protein DsbE